MAKHELVRAIERLVKERELEPNIVTNALKAALAVAYKKQYGSTYRPVVQIVNGEILMFLEKEVTDKVEFEDTEISLEEARQINPEAKVGDIIQMPIPFDANFERRVINTAKQLFLEKLNEAEKEKLYNRYKERLGEIVSGVVRKIDERNVLIDLGGKEEGVLPFKEMLPTDNFRPRDKVKAYAIDVKKDKKVPQLILSRTNNNFVKKLFEYEVQEIRDGIVEIVSLARQPGHYTKIAVKSNDPRIDPVGACVGMKGMRVQSIMRELRNEKIEIIRYSDNPQIFIMNALSPAKVVAVNIIDEKEHISEVIVPDDQLSLAIGRSGQNAKLAAKLTGWKIDIKSESEHKEEVSKIESLFSAFEEKELDEIQKIKGIGPKTAEKLMEMGITTASDIVSFSPEELSEITGIPLSTAKRVYINANKYLAGEK